MNKRVALKIVAITTIALALVTTGVTRHTKSAAAATQFANHAALVIDTGGSTKTMCVGFNEASISGVEMLNRAAGVDPVVRGYSGQGAAVCSLCRVGCPADANCLTCGGSSYWTYFRATNGSSSFKYSGAGAGSVQVRNGDVEGWRWGGGSAPAYQSFNNVCAAALASSNSPPVVAGKQITRSAQGGKQFVVQPPGGVTTLTSTQSTVMSSSTTTDKTVSTPTTALDAKNASKKITISDWISWVLLVVAAGALAYSYRRTRRRSKAIANDEKPDKRGS